MRHNPDGPMADKTNESDLTDVPVDLETAITKTGWGKFNWVMIVLMLPAASTVVFVNVAASLIIPGAKDLHLTSFDKALLQSASYAGMVTSGYVWGFLADDLGRKKLLATGFILDFIVTFGCGTVKSVPVIATFKYISGFIISGPHSVFMVYISEVFSAQHRDMVAQFIGVFTSVGGMIQAVLAVWLIPADMPSWIPFDSWQVFFVVCGLPSLIVGIASIFFSESPKFLLDKGKADEALAVCREIYSINTGKPPETYPVKKLLACNTTGHRKSFCDRLMESVHLFRNPFLTKTVAAIIIFFILFSTQNTLRLWMPEIFTLLQNSNRTYEEGLCPLLVAGHEQQSDAPRANVYSKMIIIHGACMFSHICYMLVVKRLGKKNLLVMATVVAGISISSIPLLPAVYISAISTVYIALFEVACYAFIGIVVQIFPTYLRAKSVSLTLLAGRFGIFLGNFVLSKLIYTYCEYMFLGFGIGALGILVLILLLNITPYDDTKSSY